MFETWTPQDYVNVITAVVTASAAITAAIPGTRDDEYASQLGKWWKMARKVLNVIGFNVGNAKNRED